MSQDVQLISDIGGTLGLWIGLSVLPIYDVYILMPCVCGCLYLMYILYTEVYCLRMSSSSLTLAGRWACGSACLCDVCT